MDFLIFAYWITIILLIVHLILTIFSCNKYYFFIDAVIISIIGRKYFFFNNPNVNIESVLYFLFYYICIRGIIVLITFLIKYKKKNLIRINECNLSHKILMGIDVIINLAFIFEFTRRIIVAWPTAFI
jgi:hypothetical protein